MRLIDADELLTAFPVDDEPMLTKSCVRMTIQHMPTIEPLMGKWIPHREKSREYIGTVLAYVRYDYWLCDTCGYRVEYGQPMYNFCPNCGAKMDEGES